MASNQFPNVILGTAQLSSSYGVTSTSHGEKTTEEAHSLLHCADSHQVGIVDTAPAYGDAELLIGTSKIDFEIHTKLDKQLLPEDSLRKSLQKLRVNTIDLLYAHDIDAFKKNPKIVSESLVQLLDHRVKNIGVSLYDLDDLNLVMQFPEISHVQVPMSLLDQRFTGKTLKLIHENGIKCIVRSVFLQGALLADPEKLPPKIQHLYPFLRSLRNEFISRNISPLEGCLALVGSQEGLNGLIIGAQNVDELSMIMRAWERVQKIQISLEWLQDWSLPPAIAVDPRQW